MVRLFILVNDILLFYSYHHTASFQADDLDPCAPKAPPTRVTHKVIVISLTTSFSSGGGASSCTAQSFPADNFIDSVCGVIGSQSGPLALGGWVTPHGWASDESLLHVYPFDICPLIMNYDWDNM